MQNDKNCDGVGTFECGPSSSDGTCYYGNDGFVGCCTRSSCAPRTTCLPYNARGPSTCDPDTGGCVVCKADAPGCVTVSNVVEQQYIMYCDKSPQSLLLSYTAAMAQTRIEPTLPSKTDTGTSTNTGNVGTTTQMLTTPASRMATDQSIFNSDSATEAAASMESSSPASAGVSPGSIAGITLGSVAFLIAVLLFLYVCVWRRLRAQHRFKAAGGLSRKPMGPMQEERRGIFAPNVEAWRSEIDGDAISRWADRRPERHPERSPQLVEADTPDASPRTPYTSGSRSALISNDDQGARPSWTTLDPRSNLTYVPFSPNQPPSVTHDTGRTLSTNNPPALHMENDEGCLTATGGPGRGRASYQSPEAAMRDGLRITGDGADDDGVRTDSKAHNDHQDAPATGSMP